MNSNNIKLSATSKIVKHGEDYWIPIPEPILNAVHLNDGDKVSLTVDNNTLTIKPIHVNANQSIKVIALDLEGTLISSAVSQIPRPGLYDFLQWCTQTFERVVIYTSVYEEKFREIANMLVLSGEAPNWFATIEYIHWQGNTKKLRFISNALLNEILLLDDCEMVIHPDEMSQWLPIKCFDPNFSKKLVDETSEDTELKHVIEKIDKRINAIEFD